MAKTEEDYSKVNVVLTSNGTVQAMLPGRYTSSCLVDMTMFPYDEQTCTLSFGPWAYNTKQVDMVSLTWKHYIILLGRKGVVLPH